MFHRLIGTRATVAQFYGIEEKETFMFLNRLLESPQDFASHIRQ